MDDIIYKNNVENLRSKIYSTGFDEMTKMGLLSTYLTVSANVATYFPNINNIEHHKLVQNIQFHRALSYVDQHFHHLLDTVLIEDSSNVLAQSLTQSHIYVTYHTGSYRMFIQHLNRNNVPFCMVTQQKFIDDQGETVQKLIKEVANDENKELEILPAENPRLLFELLKRLKNGISVVFYIDGNTGASDKKANENSNLFKMDFLGHHIFARQGIALLAYLSKVPLATAIATRSSDLSNTIQIKSIETISLIEQYSRNDFINLVTQTLYKELEDFLIKNLEQWEGWFYIHKFFETEDLENLKSNILLDPNCTHPITVATDQFIHMLKHDEKNIFLVKKKEYQVMKISEYVYDVLIFFNEPKQININKDLVIHNRVTEWSIIKELIEMNFLKPTG